MTFPPAFRIRALAPSVTRRAHSCMRALEQGSTRVLGERLALHTHSHGICEPHHQHCIKKMFRGGIKWNYSPLYYLLHGLKPLHCFFVCVCTRVHVCVCVCYIYLGCLQHSNVIGDRPNHNSSLVLSIGSPHLASLHEGGRGQRGGERGRGGRETQLCYCIVNTTLTSLAMERGARLMRLM